MNYNLPLGAMYLFLALFCLSPVGGWLDSSELISSSYLLGIGHPPGQPLYNMLAKLFQFIPIGSISFRTNVLSAVLLSLSMMLFGKLAVRLFKRENTFLEKSMLSLFMLALFLAYSFMEQGVRAELYSLYLLLAVSTLYVLLVIENKLPVFFLLGLAMSTHPLLGIALLPGVVFYLIANKKRMDFWIWGLFFLLVGVSAYLYLPVRSATDVIYNFGSPGNTSNFFWVISGKLYSNKAYAPIELRDFFTNAVSYTFVLYEQIGPVILFAGIVGLVVLLKNNSKVGAAILLILLCNSYLILSNRHFDIYNPDAHGYFLLSLICIGLGFLYFLYFLIDLKGIRSKILIKVVALSVFALFCALQLVVHTHDYDKNDDYSSLDFSHTITDSLPYKATIFAGSFSTYSILSNSIFVERYRSDINLLYSGFVASSGYLGNMFSIYPELSGLDPLKYKSFNLELCEDIRKLSKDVFIEPSIERTNTGYGMKEKGFIKNLHRDRWFLRLGDREGTLERARYIKFFTEEIAGEYANTVYEHKKKILQGIFLHADFNMLMGDYNAAALLVDEGLKLNRSFDAFVKLKGELILKKSL